MNHVFVISNTKIHLLSHYIMLTKSRQQIATVVYLVLVVGCIIARV